MQNIDDAKRWTICTWRASICPGVPLQIAEAKERLGFETLATNLVGITGEPKPDASLLI
jgi:hypothetical protein